MSRVVRASRSTDEDDGRRWHIPPPVLGLTGFTGPEGQVILEEVEGDAGPLLWRTFRSVATWAETRNADRGDVFPATLTSERRAWIEAIDLPGELSEPLTALASLLDTDSPTDDTAAGEAVGEIGKWATSAGFVRTGAEFHQLACSVRRSDPALALEAAKATRDLADYARAEVWLQRAIGLSRRVGEWRIYIQAHLAYGKLLRRRGNLPAARRWVERALRRANRQGLRLQQARAFHDLAAISMEMGQQDRAELYAERAFRAYPKGDPGLLRLIHDLAFLWMERGVLVPAMQAFAALKPHALPEQRPYVLGNLARVAGGLGNDAVYEASRAELAELPCMPALSEAWLEVGRGAVHLGRLEEARAAASEALRVATDRREHRIEFMVEDLLAGIDAQEGAGAPARPAERAPRNPALPDAVVAAMGKFARV
jgi:tetratricopeptide (TPR) repeat protein